MAGYSPNDIHNILIAGLRTVGKTTLADAMLFAAGTVSRQGSVDDGSSVSDHEQEERDHKHSVYPTVLHMTHEGKRINIIDVPGASELIGQTMACLPAVDMIMIVMDAEHGADGTAQRMLGLAKDFNLPVAMVINKIDQGTGKIAGFLKDLQETFGRECLPINLPAEDGTKVIGCLINGVGESDLGPVSAFHTPIIDQVVETDDALMEAYLGGEEPTYEALHAPFERAMDDRHVIPVCFANARTGVGVKELLDVTTKHFPTPIEGNPRPLFDGEGEGTPFAYESDADKPLLAHVFRVATDPYLGKLACFRVYQGKATGNSQVFVGDGKRTARLGHVFHLQGKEHIEAEEIIAGDIGAVAKIEDIRLGDILHEDSAFDGVRHRAIPYPSPLYGLAVSPKNRGDESKISTALNRVREEDPTFNLLHDPETQELVIQGVGELHLRLILERLKNRGLDVATKPPKIAYRETIVGKAEGHHRHKKQTGGAGQFGEVFLRIEPLERGEGFDFVNDTFGGSIPAQLLGAVEKGIREVMVQGIIAGYPVQDVRVRVYDGKTHPVDSKEIAFKTAGRMAFKDAFMKAKPKMLEPVVSVEVTTPSDTVGSITGDLSTRRGRVFGTEMSASGHAVVKATVPLAEIMEYEVALKSMTGGQARFTMEFSHYDTVPGQVQDTLAAEFKPHEE